VTQLFDHVSNDGFLPLPPECEKCYSSLSQEPRVTPATFGNWTEEHIRPVENKKYEWRFGWKEYVQYDQIDFDWSESKQEKFET
jgi:hypothetical protein